ncbi:MAG: hypothetical protein ACOCQG_00360 [Candidatus Nanoarchaeia archaeon]
MSKYKHISKKLKLGKHGRRTRWAPFWSVPKIYGKNRKVHPGRHTDIKRSWKRGKIKV